MEKENFTQSVPSCGLDEKSFVFVSYAHQDSATVYPVLARVFRAGYPIWYDRGINVSSTWTDEIAAAIAKCEALLLFASKNAAKSSYVRSEAEYALRLKKKVIPIYLDDMSVLPPGLALSLTPTQGITRVDSVEGIAEQICSALVFNRIKPLSAEDLPAYSSTSFEGMPFEGKKAEVWKKYALFGAAALLLFTALAFLLRGRENPVRVSEPTANVTAHKEEGVRNDEAQTQLPDEGKNAIVNKTDVTPASAKTTRTSSQFQSQSQSQRSGKSSSTVTITTSGGNVSVSTNGASVSVSASGASASGGRGGSGGSAGGGRGGSGGNGGSGGSAGVSVKKSASSGASNK
ncbi:MAG: toll/interleukin-1 receptor domain-containing protein [Synergistaceae bacterium]|jgi:hypothetical protein|nr:toll/interleukin-1 receptor domain-containing protein [Synergistaceae bacterium]